MKNVRQSPVVFGCWMLLATGCPVAGQVNIANITFPADARVVNVKNYGAIGDGIADDTAAIQKVLSGTVGFTQKNGVDHIIYLPNGTYKVSRKLFVDTGFQRYCTIEGQSRTGTILKLADATVGFTDPTHPQPVLSTLRAAVGAGDSFRNYIRDLTLDTGNGNPGAVGIDYISNNTGAIYDVTIQSSALDGAGVAGLRMIEGSNTANGINLGPGPSLIKNVSIRGFGTGIQAGISSYSLDFEHVTLTGQSICAITNDKNILIFRDLTSVNTVPVYRGTNLNAMFEVIGGTFRDGASGAVAVDNHLGGMVHLRDVRIRGYGTGIYDGNRTTATGFISEYLTYGLKSANGAVQTLRLPIQETPEVPWDDPATWANIEHYGAVSGDSGKNFVVGSWTNRGDDSAAIQAAIDSGAPTVYFPNGVYNINTTIHIRGNVRRIIGMDSCLQWGASLAASGNSLFRFDNGTAAVVVLERFETDYGMVQGNLIEHASTRTLVLRGIMQNAGNATGSNGYRTVAGGTGDVYMEDVTFTLNIAHQRAWLRQINPEGNSTGSAVAVHLLNDGGTVWCLGMKTEGVATQVKTIHGGKTEVLGGMFSSTNFVPSTTAGIVSIASATCVVAATGIDPAAQQGTVVEDQFDGANVKFLTTDFPWRALSQLHVWNGQYGPAGNFYAYQGGRMTIPYGKVIRLQSQANHLYVTADSRGASPLVATKTSVNTSERFYVDSQGGGQIVSLKASADNRFVSATKGGNGPLLANQTTARNTERFQWIDLGNGDFALKSMANGLYVVAANGGRGDLIATGTAIDAAATFHYVTYPTKAKPVARL